MSRNSSWGVLLVMLVAVRLANIADARKLLGPAPYIQCGGSGGECKGTQCKDAAWTGIECAGNFVCKRYNQYYWQCDQPPAAAPPASDEAEAAPPAADSGTATDAPTAAAAVEPPAAAPTADPTALPPDAYQQCGGIQGPQCNGDGVAKCKDAPWAGFACPSGFNCFRSNEYWWGCGAAPFVEPNA